MPVQLSEEDYNRGYFVVPDTDGATSPIESVPSGLTLRKEYDDKVNFNQISIPANFCNMDQALTFPMISDVYTSSLNKWGSN